jgi:hypothetical protein
MKYLIGIAVTTTVAILLFMVDTSPNSSEKLLGFNLISEANAVAGTRRRATRRGVAVGYNAGKESTQTQQQQQQQAAPASQ